MLHLQYAQLIQLVVLSFLAAAVISDLKKREVPNWVNYGLIITGLSLNLLHSAVTLNWTFLIFSILGAVAMLATAALMFYTGQWGGGDSKLLIGLGAAIGLQVSARQPFVGLDSQLISFLFNLVAVSLVYAVVLGTVLAFKNKKRFNAAFKKQLESYSVLRKIALAACAAGLIVAVATPDVLVKFAVLGGVAALFSGLYLSIMAKAVERACMLKNISPLKLTEGDWIAKDVIVDGKRICGPKDLGVDKSQIRQLIALFKKKKLRAIPIKEGLPFAPSFMIAYLITIFLGNVFFIIAR